MQTKPKNIHENFINDTNVLAYKSKMCLGIELEAEVFGTLNPKHTTHIKCKIFNKQLLNDELERSIQCCVIGIYKVISQPK